MRKFPILVWLAVFSLGCSTDKTSITAPVEQPVPDAKASKPSIDDLISLYPAIEFDTLWVYASSNPEEDAEFKYGGALLDTSFFSLFPEDIRDHMYIEPEVFACYKVNAGPNHIGLITRTPSEYASTSIKLFLVDRQRNTIVETFELAESWGDAGDSMTKNSWLYRDNENQLEWLFNRQDCWYETDDAEEPECTDSLAVFKSYGGKIIAVPKREQELLVLMQRLVKN